MKNMICLILMSALITAPINGFAGTDEVQARESLTRLMERYRAVKYGARDEISLACLGEVFAHWFVTYDRASHQTLDEMSARVVAYQEAKTLTMAHGQDSEKLYPELRPQLIKATREILAGYRTRKEIPDIPGPMSLTETYPAAYDQNLQKCIQTDYIQAVEAKAPPAVGFSPTTVVAAMVYSVMPVYEGGGFAGGVGIVPGTSAGKTVITQDRASMSIEDWLFQIRAR